MSKKIIRFLFMLFSVLLKNEDALSPRRKRVWRNNLSRIEIWNGKRIRVIRNAIGHFITWHKIRHYYRKSAKAQYRTQWRTTTRHRAGFPVLVPQKQVAVYGSVLGKPRRIQMSGSGQELYQALREASQHPPRQQFLTTDAGDIITRRDRFLEKIRWDRRPKIESR